MWSQRARTKTTEKHCQHATSSVLTIFQQSQSQELKEAFTMITVLVLLTRKIYLICVPPWGIFSSWVSRYHEEWGARSHKFHHVPHDVWWKVKWHSFDEEATGSIQDNYLRELPTTAGERFTDEEVGELCREAAIDKKEISTYWVHAHP